MIRPHLALFLASLLVPFPGPAQEEKQDRERNEKGAPDGKAQPPAGAEDKGKDGNQEKAGKPAIPELPKEKLPPRTRPRPDPAKVQFTRAPVYVKFAERVRPMKGEEYVPGVAVVENYLAEYFRRAGHPVVSSPREAKYRVEGSVQLQFVNILTFQGRTMGWKYRAESRVQLLDGEGQEVEKYAVPELFRESSRGEESVVLDLRRQLAKLHHEHLLHQGKTLANRTAVELLSILTVDQLEAEEPVSGSEVMRKLADLGLPAVPYLLEALTDTRPVLAQAEYPDLKNPDDLKVYHLADKVLEEIFQKVSRMKLTSTPDERFIIIRGWENEWRRFCPPFRESASTRGQAGPPGQESRK
jgi:hypothetical protein